MILFIYICILVLNVVAVLLTSHFLGPNIPKKEKAIFALVGIAVMYFIVTIAYGIATKDVNIDNNTIGKVLITYTFVPVNSMLMLPFLASSYAHWKEGTLKPDKFRNRIILLAVIMLILFLFEISYFKSIEMGIVNMLQARTAK